MSTDVDPLLNEIEAFLERTSLTPTRFGTEAINDPGLVFGLRDGRELRRSTRERVQRFMQGFQAGVAA